MSDSVKKIRLSASLSAIMLEKLVEGPHSRYELCDATGLSYGTVCAYVDALRRHNLIHIAAIAEDSRGRVQIEEFAWGPGRKDVQRRPMTHNEVQALRRRRLKDIKLYTALRLLDKEEAYAEV